MVTTLKELGQDERIRRQCEAREDYKRSMITEYSAGVRAGIEQGIEQGRELERTNTERERQCAEKAERELEELKKLLVRIE